MIQIMKPTKLCPELDLLDKRVNISKKSLTLNVNDLNEKLTDISLFKIVL